MNKQNLHERLSPQMYAALFDAAKARAVQLRGEAIGDFLEGAARAIGSALRAAGRRAWSLLNRARSRAPSRQSASPSFRYQINR
jgi:hypothetical protein